MRIEPPSGKHSFSPPLEPSTGIPSFNEMVIALRQYYRDRTPDEAKLNEFATQLHILLTDSPLNDEEKKEIKDLMREFQVDAKVAHLKWHYNRRDIDDLLDFTDKVEKIVIRRFPS